MISNILNMFFLPVRVPGMSDEDHAKSIIKCIHNNLTHGRHGTAISIINDDSYFLCLNSYCRRLLDLTILYQNEYEHYSKEYFNRQTELKIGELLLTLPQNIKLSDAELETTYSQALIRWFHICFKESINLQLILRYGDSLVPRHYHPDDRIVKTVYEYAKYILSTNILAHRYMGHILDFDKNLNECAKFDRFLETHEKQKYFLQLMSEAEKCVNQKTFKPNFYIFSALKPKEFENRNYMPVEEVEPIDNSFMPSFSFYKLKAAYPRSINAAGVALVAAAGALALYNIGSGANKLIGKF